MRRKGQQLLPPLLDTDDLKIGDFYVVKRFNGAVDEKFISNLIDVKEVSERQLLNNRSEKAARLSQDGKKPSDAKRPRLEIDGVVDSPKASPRSQDDKKSEDGRHREGSQDGSEKSDTPPESRTHRLYYIHYEGLDRRLDEWVERDRFVERALQPALCSPAVLPTGVENATQASNSGTITRSQKRIHVEFHHQQTSYDDMDATTARLEKEHEERTKVKNVETIVMNGYEITTWYFSPYPYQDTPNLTLFICDFCLVYSDKKERITKHKKLCERRCPPGDEVYRDGNISLYEVMGKANKTYCQALCLLSKLFLDHKTLYFDVDTFVFYILCEVSATGARIMGHFSKEMHSENNLACIMVLPQYQRKGYGKLLIQISYELSSREGWIGTPEKPLSDLGKVSYRSYWWWRLLEVMDEFKIDDVSVRELSRMSKIHHDDIIATLQTMSMIKYWKGENIVRTSSRIVEHCKSLNMAKPPTIMLKLDKLRWTPRDTRESPYTASDRL